MRLDISRSPSLVNARKVIRQFLDRSSEHDASGFGRLYSLSLPAFDIGPLVFRDKRKHLQDYIAEKSTYQVLSPPRIEKSGSNGFTYEGVKIVPIKTASGMDLKFSCQGHSLVVKNYTKAEFDKIFGL